MMFALSLQTLDLRGLLIVQLELIALFVDKKFD